MPYWSWTNLPTILMEMVEWLEYLNQQHITPAAATHDRYFLDKCFESSGTTTRHVLRLWYYLWKKAARIESDVVLTRQGTPTAKNYRMRKQPKARTTKVKAGRIISTPLNQSQTENRRWAIATADENEQALAAVEMKKCINFTEKKYYWKASTIRSKGERRRGRQKCGKSTFINILQDWSKLTAEDQYWRNHYFWQLLATAKVFFLKEDMRVINM